MGHMASQSSNKSMTVKTYHQIVTTADPQILQNFMSYPLEFGDGLRVTQSSMKCFKYLV